MEVAKVVIMVNGNQKFLRFGEPFEMDCGGGGATVAVSGEK